MRSRYAILGFLAGMELAACVDLSAVDFRKPDTSTDAGSNPAGDAGDDDAGSDDAGTVIREACRMCLANGACMMQSAACDANPRCTAYVNCMTETDCWRSPITDFMKVPACIANCAGQVGIMSQVDPANGLFLAVLLCAQKGPDAGGCAASCAPNLIQ